MEFIILGIVVCFNFMVVLRKLRLARFTDACVDIGLCLFLSFLFSGSYAGLVVANVASFLISLYLFKNPVTVEGFMINKEIKKKEEWKEKFDLELPITRIAFDPSRRYL